MSVPTTEIPRCWGKKPLDLCDTTGVREVRRKRESQLNGGRCASVSDLKRLTDVDTCLYTQKGQTRLAQAELLSESKGKGLALSWVMIFDRM